MQTDTKNQETATQEISLDLQKIIEDLFLVLTTKERDVIVRRFSIYNEPKQTLEKIGKQFAVTRERVRQIEKIALSKLRRTVKSTKLNLVNDLATAIMKKHGGVMTDERLVSEILNSIYSKDDVDAHVVRLALHINSDLAKVKQSSEFRPFWRFNDISMSQIRSIIKSAIDVLKKNKDILIAEKIATAVLDNLSDKYEDLTQELIVSTLETDHRIKEIDGNFGLMSWRHINPKSIRDKAYIVLKKGKNPLHFVEISNKIAESGFDKKVVTTQAVHNELIRCDYFVLVGRGLYALKEWGYKPGTVAEIICDLLRKKSPMTKQEIIQGVLKQRNVKKGTISLNLQKVPCFVRVGRAVYALDESKGMK